MGPGHSFGGGSKAPQVEGQGRQLGQCHCGDGGSGGGIQRSAIVAADLAALAQMRTWLGKRAQPRELGHRHAACGGSGGGGPRVCLRAPPTSAAFRSKRSPHPGSNWGTEARAQATVHLSAAEAASGPRGVPAVRRQRGKRISAAGPPCHTPTRFQACCPRPVGGESAVPRRRCRLAPPRACSSHTAPSVGLMAAREAV